MFEALKTLQSRTGRLPAAPPVRWSIPQPEVKRLADANSELVAIGKRLTDLLERTNEKQARTELQEEINRLLNIVERIDSSVRSAIYLNNAG